MQSFKVTMTRTVILAFFFLVILVAAGTAWAFGSGLVWTGICLIAVAGPLSLLYWYMLWANPSRTRLTVLDQGLHLKVPPFFTAEVPWQDIRSVALAGHDEALAEAEADRSMRFGGYVSGVFKLESGRELLVAARPGRVVVLETESRRYVLGPNRVDEFHQAVAARAR